MTFRTFFTRMHIYTLNACLLSNVQIPWELPFSISGVSSSMQHTMSTGTKMHHGGNDGRKRQRQAFATLEDLLNRARIVMHNDPFKERAPALETRHFRALFGCAPSVALTLWNLLAIHGYPENGTMHHFLWMLIYLKSHPNDVNLSKLTGADPKTNRKWIDAFLCDTAALEPHVASLTLFLASAPHTHLISHSVVLFSFGSSGEIDASKMLAMTVWFRSMALIFK